MAPIDVGVRVLEEREPTGLELGEDPGLVVAVAGVVRRVPGDQVVGDAEPGTDRQVGIVRDVGIGQRLERTDQTIAVLAAEEPQEVRQEPRVAGVAGVDEVVDGTRVERTGVDPLDDSVDRVVGGGIRRVGPRCGGRSRIRVTRRRRLIDGGRRCAVGAVSAVASGCVGGCTGTRQQGDREGGSGETSASHERSVGTGRRQEANGASNKSETPCGRAPDAAAW